MLNLSLACGSGSGLELIVFLALYGLARIAVVALPILILCGIVFMACKARQAKRNALPANLCPHCHYDLRATPDANGPLLEICPECGQLDQHLLRPA